METSPASHGNNRAVRKQRTNDRHRATQHHKRKPRRNWIPNPQPNTDENGNRRQNPCFIPNKRQKKSRTDKAEIAVVTGFNAFMRLVRGSILNFS